MQWLLPAAFIILPFGFLSFGSFNKGQIITLIISAFAVLAIKVKPLSLRLFCWYVAGWTAYRHVYKVYGDPYFGPAPEPALNAMILFVAGTILYIAVTESELETKWFFLAICCMAVFQALIGLGQTLHFNPVFDVLPSNFKNGLTGTTATGTLGNQDFLMAFIAIALPLFYRKWWVLAMPLFVWLLFTSKVSTAVIAALIGSSAFFWKGRSFVSATGITVFATMLGIAYFIIVDTNTLFLEKRPTMSKPGIEKKTTTLRPIAGKRPSSHSRAEMRNIAIKQINTWSRILFGFGPGSGWGGKGALHNDWLSIFHTFGLVGLSLVSAFVWNAVKKAKDDRTMLAVIVTICINALGNLPMQLAPSIFLILIIFVLAQREVVNG